MIESMMDLVQTLKMARVHDLDPRFAREIQRSVTSRPPSDEDSAPTAE